MCVDVERRLIAGRRFDHAAGIAVGTMDPIVQSPNQPVDLVLRVVDTKALQYDACQVSLAVTVGILGIENLRRASDQDAFPPGHHASGSTQSA